ncbi:MAG: pitrilysin family protein, partial [Porphyromonas sp.]|nr:pitrilysin family protein [Porphyromonas sp.]
MFLNKIKSLGLLLFVALGVQSAFAQGQLQPLPIDPMVRYGKLDNGLTYFIRHNEQPKERAHFYIAQRVGSMLEEDSQSGLAHFLEHMAFNGTKNFPGKNLINYLESIGIKFGSNLNAYTGFDETVYTIMDAPTTRQGIVDSCLLILHDWSNNITLDHKEIDDERGVIHEEWRGSQNANMRMIEKILPLAFPNGNMYGKRLPIGSMDIVLNFKYKEIKDYYKKWYRPDLQALIIVGDIDVDYVENKIKEQFADVKKPENAAERFYTQIPDNKEPIVAIATDPEATLTGLSFSYSRDVLPEEVKSSVQGLVLDYLSAAISTMFNERISEILQKPNAPFLSASMSNGKYMGLAKTKDALGFDVYAKEGQYLTAMNALIAEMKRAKDFGFTASEYDRFRTNILKSSEESLKNKANKTNGAYAEEYKDFFTDGGRIPGVEVEHQLLSMIAPQITVEQVNEYFKQVAHGENLLITLMGPEKAGLKYPTSEELLSQYNAALQQTVEPYKEEVSNEKLIENLPKAGKVISVKKDLPYETTLWTLSNGVKVYLKKTDFKENQIILSGMSPGGFRMLNVDKEVENIKLQGAVTSLGGVGNFNTIQLSKALTGRVATASAEVGEFYETVSGASSNTDVETMLQLVYLRMTANRSDKEAFEAFKQNAIERIRSAAANPMSSISDTIPA